MPPVGASSALGRVGHRHRWLRGLTELEGCLQLERPRLLVVLGCESSQRETRARLDPVEAAIGKHRVLARTTSMDVVSFRYLEMIVDVVSFRKMIVVENKFF